MTNDRPQSRLPVALFTANMTCVFLSYTAILAGVIMALTVSLRAGLFCAILSITFGTLADLTPLPDLPEPLFRRTRRRFFLAATLASGALAAAGFAWGDPGLQAFGVSGLLVWASWVLPTFQVSRRS